MPSSHRNEVAKALREASKATYTNVKQVAIAVAQVHATLEVARQIELLRTEGLRVGRKGLFDDMHYCGDTNIATSGAKEACPRCTPS